MIIPLRCYTCGKVLADKYRYYQNETKNLEDTIVNVNVKNVQKSINGKVLDKLGLKRICCRVKMLTHKDLIE